MNGAGFWITITIHCFTIQHLVSQRGSTNRILPSQLIIFRKYEYSKGVGMRFQYSNNRILEKTDFDKIENDRHKFVWYPEFDECAEGEIMISIEHW
jgi:hypothetical protein